MRETGNNRRRLKNITSIRLSPDGLCFWTGDTVTVEGTTRIVTLKSRPRKHTHIAANHATAQTIGRVVDKFKPQTTIIYVASAETVLVPGEIYTIRDALTYIEKFNYRKNKGSGIFTTSHVSGTVAVTVFANADLLHLLKETIPGEILVATPLQHNLLSVHQYPTRRRNTVMLTTDPGVAHVTFHGPTGKVSAPLLFADTYRFVDQRDLGYFITKLTEAFGRGLETRICLNGRNAWEFEKFLSRFFKTTLCE